VSAALAWLVALIVTLLAALSGDAGGLLRECLDTARAGSSEIPTAV
jgi:hypothetical protein